MAINWFNKTVDEVESTLKTNAENGLTAEEAQKRQEEYGLNELKAKKKKSKDSKTTKKVHKKKQKTPPPTTKRPAPVQRKNKTNNKQEGSIGNGTATIQ